MTHSTHPIPTDTMRFALHLFPLDRRRKRGSGDWGGWPASQPTRGGFSTHITPLVFCNCNCSYQKRVVVHSNVAFLKRKKFEINTGEKRERRKNCPLLQNISTKNTPLPLTLKRKWIKKSELSLASPDGGLRVVAQGHGTLLADLNLNRWVRLELSTVGAVVHLEQGL